MSKNVTSPTISVVRQYLRSVDIDEKMIEEVVSVFCKHNDVVGTFHLPDFFKDEHVVEYFKLRLGADEYKYVFGIYG